MKKQATPILVLLTAVFAAFTMGFFVGRNQGGSPIQVSIPQSGSQTNSRTPSETAPQSEPTEIPTQAQTEATQSVTYPININTADSYTLTQLPGIGQVLADRIIAYRRENGSFSVVEELMNVDGIGAGKLEDIINLVTTGG